MNKMLMNVTINQRMALSPQLIQNIALLQYTNVELKKLFDKFIEENIFLESDEENGLSPRYLNTNIMQDEFWNGKPLDGNHDFRKYNEQTIDDSFCENYASPKTLRNYLLEQTLLCQFNSEQQVVAEAIIDAINDDGQLSSSLEEIRESHYRLFAIPLITFNHVLSVIQGFDPAGIAWRSRKECLLIQLVNFFEQDHITILAQRIVTNYFESIHNGLSKRQLRELDISTSEYTEAILLILSLDPKPGRQFSQECNFNIVPDLIVKKYQGKWRVFLNNAAVPQVQLSRSYEALLKSVKTHECYPVLKDKLCEAHTLLTGLKTRNETLLRVGEFIIDSQQDFLEYGPSHLKPLVISDITAALDLHGSTISRITTGKYVATPRGAFELKYFFSSHVTTTSGEHCSATAVKMHIKNIIAMEDKSQPYSDIRIVHILKERSIHVARRTIAKYREALRIAPAYLRVSKEKAHV